jgi:hypothetical protein
MDKMGKIGNSLMVRIHRFLFQIPHKLQQFEKLLHLNGCYSSSLFIITIAVMIFQLGDSQNSLNGGINMDAPLTGFKSLPPAHSCVISIKLIFCA